MAITRLEKYEMLKPKECKLMKVRASGKMPTARLKGTTLKFDELPGQEHDLSKLQTEVPRRLRFTMSKDKVVSVDKSSDYWLIAEVDIPARKVVTEPVLDEKGESVLDDMGSPKVNVVEKPMTADEVKLTVWELP